MRPRDALTFVALTALVVGPLIYGLLRLEYPWTWTGYWKTPTRVTRLNPERKQIYVAGALDYVIARKSRFRDDDSRIPGPLLTGVGVTLLISAAALCLALPAGIALGLGSVSPNLGLRAWCSLYVETLRNSPLLIQIFIFYYLVGSAVDEIPLGPLGSVWSDYRAASLGVLALAAFSSAYLGEIVRGGIESLPPGQYEAARALGLSHGQAMWNVILPQALRASLPAMAGQFINLVKDSSLLSVTGVLELTKAARESIGTSILTLELWILAALLYLLLTLPLSQAVRALERRLARADR